MRQLNFVFFFVFSLYFVPQLIAADFRIETHVYAAGEKEAVSESVTLFSSGVAYDFRDQDYRVTIFRPGALDKPGRFVLLDTKEKCRSEISADKVAVAITNLRRWAAQQEDPFLRFTGDPSFEEKFDAATGELRMTSEHLSYRLVTMPVANAESMAELSAFLDAFAQLHTLLEAGLPPTPRLLVNESLKNREVVPIEVELFAGAIENEPSLRADHLVTWILSKQDRERIDRTTVQMTEFKEVDNAYFSKNADQQLAQGN